MNMAAMTDEELEELMRQRGLEKLEEHIQFETVDGTINTGSMSYKYGVDFKLGDFVSIQSMKLGVSVNMQITSVTKTISNGVEILDIGFGKDRLDTMENEERSMY